MSRKPTSIRKTKKLAQQLPSQPKTQQYNSSSHKKEKELTLHEAYEIIGGYTNTISPRVFERALKMVMEVDPQFAKAIEALYNNGTSFKQASNEQLATAEQIIQNAESLNIAYSDNTLFNEVIFDQEINEAFEHTPVSGISPEEYRQTAFASAQTEIITELAEDVEYNEARSEKKRGLLVSRLKNSIKRSLFRERCAALGKDISSIKKALNFKEIITVSASSIAETYERVHAKTSDYIKDLHKKGHLKAALFLNKAKTKVHKTMVKIATVSVLLSSFLPSCSGDNSQQASSPMPVKQEKTVVVKDTVKNTTDIVTDSVPSVATPAMEEVSKHANDSIAFTVPVEWSDSLGISKGNWKATQAFLDYENAYKKISDDMLAKSGFQTREQFLDAYRILRSYYPKVIENQGDVLLNRSETSEKFSKFFSHDDCIQASDFTQEDFDILKIAPELRGNRNVRANREVKGQNPCESGTVQYVQTVSKKSKKNDTVNPAPAVQLDEQEVSPVVSDTIPQYRFSEETGRSRVVIEEKTDTTSLKINVFRGNNLKDGKHVGTISAEDIVGKKVTTKDVFVEQTSGKTFTFEETGSSRVDTTKTTPQFTFEETGSSRVNTTKTTPQFTFEETGSSRVNTTKTTPQFTFEETGSSRVDTTKTTPQFTFEETGSSRVEDTTVAPSDSVQIVGDSAELPVGTPSAGYVDERGGVNNCGLNPEQLKYSKAKITNQWGESAYDELMAGISDEMLSKGNIFEGLTREQAIYNLSVWSVSFPHSPETDLIYSYVLNCHQGETMSADDTAKAKAAMDRIRVNKTIDGVVFNKPIYVSNVQNMGCDKKVKVNATPVSGNVSATSPSGPKFPRLFSLKVQSPEPIIYSFQETGRSRVEYTDTPTKPLTINEYRGNNLNISDGLYIGDVDAADIVNKKVTEREIMVEQTSGGEQKSSQESTVDSKKADKKAKKAQRQARRAAEKAKKEAQKLADEKRRAAAQKYAGGSDFVHNEVLQAIKNSKSK